MQYGFEISLQLHIKISQHVLLKILYISSLRENGDLSHLRITILKILLFNHTADNVYLDHHNNQLIFVVKLL